MKISIIIHSQSGFTAKVARALDTTLTGKGHEVDTQLLRTSGKVAPRSKDFELKNIPDVKDCDVLVLGGPVWAFGPSPVIMKYIAQLGRLSGKKVFCFVTKGLPFGWTGGTQAIKAMRGELSMSDAELLPGEMLHMSIVRSDRRLQDAVNRMAAAVA